MPPRSCSEYAGTVPRPASFGRSARTGLALLSALALAGLGAWFLVTTPGARGPRSAAREVVPLVTDGREPAPEERLQPAPEPARSTFQPAAENSAPAATARLVVRVRHVEGPGAESTIVTLVQRGGRSTSEFELAASQPSLELTCAPGEVSVSARSAGPAPRLSLAAHAILQPGATELVELVLAPQAALAGTLEDESGKPLEGLAVRLRRRDELLAQSTSDAGGRFWLGPLPSGEYELVLGDPQGPLRPPELLELGPGESRRTFVLPVLLALELRTLDADGRALAGVRLEGTGKPGGRLQGVSDVDGRLRVEGLPPGDYRLFARHDTFGRATRALALDARSSADEHELVLRR